MNLHASYVSVDDFDGLYFQVSFYAEDPDADVDLTVPEAPYLLIQRQFEDEDGGVCYIETHEPDTYAGHFRLHLVELNRTRLMFEIDRPADRSGRSHIHPRSASLQRGGAGPAHHLRREAVKARICARQRCARSVVRPRADHRVREEHVSCWRSC